MSDAARYVDEFFELVLIGEGVVLLTRKLTGQHLGITVTEVVARAVPVKVKRVPVGWLVPAGIVGWLIRHFLETNRVESHL